MTDTETGGRTSEEQRLDPIAQAAEMAVLEHVLGSTDLTWMDAVIALGTVFAAYALAVDGDRTHAAALFRAMAAQVEAGDYDANAAALSESWHRAVASRNDALPDGGSRT